MNKISIGHIFDIAIRPVCSVFKSQSEYYKLLGISLPGIIGLQCVPKSHSQQSCLHALRSNLKLVISEH